jgi:ribosomal protein S18 acetylase RimI-like enzyme
MPEIEVRPATASDIPSLISLDHNYTTEYVWQMIFQSEHAEGQSINFRRIHLPRPVRGEYPRSPRSLSKDWEQRSEILVAVFKKQAIGYISLMLNKAPSTAWITDLVVARSLRRQGIGSALLLASLEWATNTGCDHLVLEMQPKNIPAIQLAQKLGFEFCGYNDLYYPEHEIAIFFQKSI